MLKAKLEHSLTGGPYSAYLYIYFAPIKRLCWVVHSALSAIYMRAAENNMVS